MKIKAYYNLAKPGMVYGNLLTAIAGYLLASGLRLKWSQFIAMAIGTALVMGSACVLNNLADRDIDSLMERTQKRPSVNGDISYRQGLVFAVLMLASGMLLIVFKVNALCALIGLIGFVDYAFVYTYSKRKTYHATLIGSIAGAAPIVGGYVAYSGHITLAALIVGLMMFLWQMPHFYAIALFREDDYRKANIPVAPISKGHKFTKYSMVIYTIAFSLASFALYAYSNLNIFYLVVMAVLATLWLAINVKGLLVDKLEAWAKQSFLVSLIVMSVMSLVVAVR